MPLVVTSARTAGERVSLAGCLLPPAERGRSVPPFHGRDAGLAFEARRRRGKTPLRPAERWAQSRRLRCRSGACPGLRGVLPPAPIATPPRASAPRPASRPCHSGADALRHAEVAFEARPRRAGW